jgi:hypothetical protein
MSMWYQTTPVAMQVMVDYHQSKQVVSGLAVFASLPESITTEEGVLTRLH